MGIIVNVMCVQPGYVKERLGRWVLGQGARIEHRDLKCITLSLFIMWNLGLHVHVYVHVHVHVHVHVGVDLVRDCLCCHHIVLVH
jgi:hypothetical protein